MTQAKHTVRTRQYAVVTSKRVIFARAKGYQDLVAALSESGFTFKGSLPKSAGTHVLLIEEVFPDEDASIESLATKWSNH
jgi:hypothetical protein